VPNDSRDVREGLAKEGRLWLLAAVCALVGALTVWKTNSLADGIGAFLLSLIVLGGALYVFEKRRKR
jgi:4-hydroxybenzoate polyprenyltransferase